ncbi:MAG: methyltransferase domain-containing protein [bacterium]|nr:methyltransferase domain-containing protein [bacterium]
MSFDPVPATITELCRGASASWRALELGCGDGQMRAHVRAAGAWCAGLDCAPRGLAAAVDVRGDARHPPLRARSLDLVLAANLVRHLVPGDPELRFLASWLELLRPGGSVFVLEDEPSSGAAAANHRDLQALLARLAPTARGPLLAKDTFETLLPAHLRRCVVAGGTEANRWRQDAAAAMAMLASGHPRAGGEADRLLSAIRRHGLECGRMWWLRLQAE